jgi:Repeat of unknown function (DUF5650)/Carboxypeptidase regulatory-like domain
MNLTKTLLTLVLTTCVSICAFGQTRVDIAAPEGSERFGYIVKVLPNGNFVVVDPYYSDPAGTRNIGAAYLYDGATRQQISMLTGSQERDFVHPDVHVLTDGNYLVTSQSWKNGAAINAGSVTWCSSSAGCNGTISAENSLVGGSSGDSVYQVQTLANGEYVVISPSWKRGALSSVGAVTYCKTGGCRGAVSESNSIVGSRQGDMVGRGWENGDAGFSDFVTVLPNNNFLIHSANWTNAATGAAKAGALTFCNVSGNCIGEVSETNSLVGSTAFDFVGYTASWPSIKVLANGNFVVQSPRWNNGSHARAGAATFGTGSEGVKGVISAANSLVGTGPMENIGANVTALTNGNYVVQSSGWDNGTIVDAGAVVFGNGVTGISGTISASNALVGTSPGDGIFSGLQNVFALRNGDYVAVNPNWSKNTVSSVGAVTYSNGSIGTTGPITSENSFVGQRANDQIGRSGILEVANGIVVLSPFWDNGNTQDVGAATFLRDTFVGTVTPENSLIGGSANDRIGTAPSKVLSNGNYVIVSALWRDENGAAVGAATFGNGSSGVSGVVTSANSLVGSKAGDLQSAYVTPLPNGNYLLSMRYWDNGPEADAGAVAFGNGNTGVIGIVGPGNSLVGSRSNDSHAMIRVLSNGNYFVLSPTWGSGRTNNPGAVTFGSQANGVFGEISSSNSLLEAAVWPDAIKELQGGNLLIPSGAWNNNSISMAGAVTFARADVGITGRVSQDNSLVGTVTDQRLGESAFVPARDGAFLVVNGNYSTGDQPRVGAVTYGNFGITGTVGSNYSIFGTTPNGGGNMKSEYDPQNSQFIIGRDIENTVTVLRISEQIAGRVLTPAGQPLRNVRVTLADSAGVRTATTGSFGGFVFEDVLPGREYTLSVTSKRFRFAPLVLNLTTSVSNIELIGQE